MSRHSKHSNDRSFYSYKERVDAGFAGHRKEVLGTDAFLPFGYCCLSLKPAKEPVATPEGHIYDKQYILESLLNQKLAAQTQNQKYEEQERAKARKIQSDGQQAELAEIKAFEEAERGLLSQDARHNKRVIEDDGRPEKKKLREGELLVIDKAKMREKAFWAAETTPNAAPAQIKKADATPRCPMSGKKLRAKDLLPVTFEVTDQKMMDEGGGRGVFCCAISKHPIVHQQAVLLKPSGQVVLESTLKDCVYKDMKCPITGKPIKGKEDILKLQMGGSGFSAHNEVTAKSWSHIRSVAGDNATQQGHLPRAGFVGLH